MVPTLVKKNFSLKGDKVYYVALRLKIILKRDSKNYQIVGKKLNLVRIMVETLYIWLKKDAIDNEVLKQTDIIWKYHFMIRNIL